MSTMPMKRRPALLQYRRAQALLRFRQRHKLVKGDKAHKDSPQLFDSVAGPNRAARSHRSKQRLCECHLWAHAGVIQDVRGREPACLRLAGERQGCAGRNKVQTRGCMQHMIDMYKDVQSIARYIGHILW